MMTEQQNTNYNRIANAIEYINAHFKEQPKLEDVAEHIHLSPFHLQRLFSEWAGTSPKKFLQYTTLAYAKRLLQDRPANLFEVAYEAGLSGTSRLHDLFVNIEGMTPAEYKNGGAALTIQYSFAPGPFGNLLVATTNKGVCHMAFADEREAAIAALQRRFPNALFQEQTNVMQQQAFSFFDKDWTNMPQIKLHLAGTDFQLKVWQTLLKIPEGKLSTYGAIAKSISMPGASRAVGTAIGSNPIAVLIPCHRVIQASGVFGGYMWGKTRKAALIGWEGVKTHPED